MDVVKLLPLQGAWLLAVYPGRCPGLGASALSGRVGQLAKSYSERVVESFGIPDSQKRGFHHQSSVWICGLKIQTKNLCEFVKSVGQRKICGTKNNVTFGGLSSIVLKKGAFQNLPSRWRWGWKSILSWWLGLRFRGWMGYECTVVNLRPYGYIVYARTLVALRPYICRVFNRTLVEKWMFFEFFTFC